MKLASLSIDGKPVECPPGLPCPKEGMVQGIITNALAIFIVIGIIVSVITVVWAGIMWITSGGDKQKLASAKARLTWAVIGLIVMFLSFLIINMISYVFGVKLLNLSL